MLVQSACRCMQACSNLPSGAAPSKGCVCRLNGIDMTMVEADGDNVPLSDLWYGSGLRAQYWEGATLPLPLHAHCALAVPPCSTLSCDDVGIILATQDCVLCNHTAEVD